MPRLNSFYGYGHDYWLTLASQSQQQLRSRWKMKFTFVVAAIALITHWGQPSAQKMQQKLPQGTAIGR